MLLKTAKIGAVALHKLISLLPWPILCLIKLEILSLAAEPAYKKYEMLSLGLISTEALLGLPQGL